MKELILANLTTDYYSGESGLNVGKLIDQRLARIGVDEQMAISFYGIREITPSFINGVILYPLELYGIDYIRKHIKYINATASVAAQIKDAIQKYEATQQKFRMTLMTSKIYLSTNNIELYNEVRYKFNQYSFVNNIANADLVIVMVSNQNIVASQGAIRISKKLGKRVIVLVESNLPLGIRSNNNCLIIRYRKGQHIQAIRNLNKRIQVKRLYKQPANSTMTNNTQANAGAWILLGLLAIIVISAVVTADKTPSE